MSRIHTRVSARAGAAVLIAGVLVGCSPGATPSASTVAPTTPASAAVASPSAAPPDCGDYPNKDIELVIPASPGGGFDTWARLVAPFLEEHLAGDAKVLPVNVPGAGTMLGVTEVYGAAPDGYTIGIAEPGVIATQQLAAATEVEVNRLRAIGRLTVSPELMVVGANSEHGSIQELVAAAKVAPLKMAMAGLAAVQVVSLDALELPYTTVNHEGSQEAVLSLVRGDTDFSIFTLTSLTDNVVAGDVKPMLVVGTKPAEGDPGYDIVKDTPSLDEVTGQAELGAALEQHRLLIAPPDTEDCVVAMLEEAMLASLADPDLQPQLDEAGYAAFPKTAAETQAIMAGVLTGLEPYNDLLVEKLAE